MTRVLVDEILDRVDRKSQSCLIAVSAVSTVYTLSDLLLNTLLNLLLADKPQLYRINPSGSSALPESSQYHRSSTSMPKEHLRRIVRSFHHAFSCSRTPRQNLGQSLLDTIRLLVDTA
jgi:hypothetical protein